MGGRVRPQTLLQQGWLAVLASALALACSAPRQRLPPRPSLLESSRPLEQELSPPEWRYHTRHPAALARAYALDAGASLFVGALGERWLVEPGAAATARPAAVLAPEALVGVL